MIIISRFCRYFYYFRHSYLQILKKKPHYQKKKKKHTNERTNELKDNINVDVKKIKNSSLFVLQ